MLASILRHEWRTLSSDYAVRVGFGILAAAIAYGTFNGVQWVAFQRGAIEAARAEESERFTIHEATIVRINDDAVTVTAASDPRNPDAVGRGLGSRYAVLPPTPLAALSIGQADLLPSYFRMTTDARETVLGAAELENPHRLLHGRFDLAFVLIYLYPLLILALSYNLLSAEREQGTLVLALSQPVSLRTLALGKVGTRLAAVLGATLSFATIAFLIGGIDVRGPDALARLGLWLSVVVGYGFFWFTLSVSVTAAGKPSSVNAMVVLGAWLVLVVLVPSTLNMVATTLFPVPSRVEMIQAMRVASDKANQEGSSVLARYYEDHPELVSGDAEQAINEVSMVRAAVNAEVDRAVAPVLQRYREQLDRQQHIVDRVRYLSPAILMQDALNDVSGTSTSRHRAFVDQVTVYHHQWRDFFSQKVFLRHQLRDFSEIPRFEWMEEPVVAVVGRVAVDLFGLLIPAAGLAAVGLVRLRSYQVTG